MNDFEMLQNQINEVCKRISELEKSLEPKLKLDYMLKMNQLVKNDKAHQAIYKKLFNEIAELREQLEGERGIRRSIRFHQNKIKEVLREFILMYKDYNPHLWERINQILEKLDSKTEKKEVKEIYQTVHEAFLYLEKDLGGEKSVEVEPRDSKDEVGSRDTDSKTLDSLTRYRDKVLEPFDENPPEPKRVSVDMREAFPEFYNEDGTSKEPRENEIDKEKEAYMRYCAASEKQLISEFVEKLTFLINDYGDDRLGMSLIEEITEIKEEYEDKLK